MSNRFWLVGTLVGALLLAPLPTSPAATYAAAPSVNASTKLHVHVRTSTGKHVGHARLTIRRVGAKKPLIHHRTNAAGNFKTGKLPAGTYVVRSRHSGWRDATGSMAVVTTGTHNMTVVMSKRAAIITTTAIHGRVVHALGVKAAVKPKAVAKAAKEKTEPKTETKPKPPATKTPPPHKTVDQTK